MMMVQFLLDTDADVRSPASPRRATASPTSSSRSQSRSSRRSASRDQINALAATARGAGDFAAEQFMQWFIKEQVEEVATMTDLLRVAERSRDDVTRPRGLRRARARVG